MAWRYYDLNANWDKVYKVWQGDAVQNALEPQMKDWCEQHAPHRPTWHRGDSLWQYSRTDYHFARSLEAANNLVESENVAEQLLAALRRHGLNYVLDQLWESEIWNRAFGEYMCRSHPKRGTLESMILVGGAAFLEDAHLVLAQELFPEEHIVIGPGGDHCRVYLCQQHVMLDFIGYWWYTQDKSEEHAPGLIRDLKVIAVPA